MAVLQASEKYLHTTRMLRFLTGQRLVFNPNLYFLR